MTDDHAPPDTAAAGQRTEVLRAALDALRREGAAAAAPARFAHAEALARRLGGQPDAVRVLHERRLEAALADCGERLERARAAAVRDAEGLAAATPALAREARRLTAAHDYRGLRALAARGASRPLPLARLNREHAATVGEDPEGQMRSVSRFRDAWTRIRTDERVEAALGRAPANAGPLNSHVVVVRTLRMIREISPDYLRRFVAQADALLALEDIAVTAAGTAPARRQARRR